MKFLCDNCKAKYQISDDKVAGKTVRMKCRKCGHQIEVRAAVTETSVSMAPPTAPAPAGPPTAPQAPKRPGLAANLSAPRPQTQKMTRPETSALAGAFAKSVHDEAPKSIKPSSSSAPPSALDALDVSMTDEWYVAINGVPVGPVRVSELRRKAGGGAVTEDSLCWQEGLEEWRPIKSIPELARIVREAALSGRPSLTSNSERTSANPPPPTVAMPQAPPRAPMAPSMGIAPSGGMAPRPPPPTGAPRPLAPAAAASSPNATGRNNVVPFSGRHATAEKIDEVPRFSAPPAPMPMPTPMSAPMPAPPMPAPNAPVASDPFAMPPQVVTGQHFVVPALAPLPQNLISTNSSPSSIIAAPKKGTPIWAIAAIAFAGCFGIAVAILVFMPKQQPAQPPNVVIQMPPTATATAPADSSLATASSANGVASADPASSASSGKIATNGPKNTAGGTAPATTRTGADLKGLLGDGPGGPNVGPGGPGGPGSGGGLDANAVQNVVRNRAPGVKRKCWDSGTNDQKSSANVQVAVTVAPNGSVSNAVATGDDPTISHCIEREVKTWSFPAPGSTTTVNIPFHFVRQ